MYDRWLEVEVPEIQYVFIGRAAPMNGRFTGGGTQIFIEDDVVGEINWNVVENELGTIVH